MKSNPLVLVADDDAGVREAVAIRLTQSGMRVVGASNADQAIELFNRWSPDAAVLDVRMPGSDGLAVCEHIRKRGSQVPVFILTGAEDGLIRQHLALLTRTVGANYFIIKPFDGKTLALMIRDALDPAYGGT